MNGIRDVRKHKSYRPALVRGAIALLLTTAAAWLSIRHIRWADLAVALARPDWLLLAAALATVLATTGAKAARWLVLLRCSRTQAPAGRVLRVLLIGQMGNSFLPARMGDVGRAVLLGPQSGGGVPAVLGTIVVEKALDGIPGLLILSGLALWTPLPGWLRRPVLGFALLATFLLVLLVLAAVRQTWAERTLRLLIQRLPPAMQSRTGSLLARFGQGLGLLRAPRDALLALGWSGIVWGLAALTNVLVLTALDIPAPGWSSWLVLVVGYVANFLPAVPGQVGVFEYACVLALTAAGVGAEPALAFGIVLHLLVYGPPALLGPASMVVEGMSWSALRRIPLEPMEQNGTPI